jgi:hypothetical protein
VATREEKFSLAAWGYVIYGIIYWVGALVLALAGLGPRPAGNPAGLGLVITLFVIGGALVVVIPWLLVRERSWFERWVLSRPDFARILTVFVAYRAVEVGRLAWRPPIDLISVGGFAIPMRLGAIAFFVVTVAMVVLLARAGWSRDP